MTTEPKITLTIAGNDASGGAGIAADLKTFAEYGTFGIASLAVIATMDPATWKHSTYPIDTSILKEQLNTATSNVQRISAFKTGMLPTVESIQLIAGHIKEHDLKNFVLDPVMVCKGEDEVLNPETANALREVLAPLATVATPNLFEAGQLSGLGEPETVEEMKAAAQKIYNLGTKNVVITGGRNIEGNKAIDLFYDGEFTVLETPKISGGAKHGAGCTFSAAITAGIAQGLSPKDSVKKAKQFVTEAINKGFQYNEHVEPVYHSAYRLNRQDNI